MSMVNFVAKGAFGASGVMIKVYAKDKQTNQSSTD